MKKWFGNVISKTKDSVCNFTSNPINDLGFLIPVLIVLITFTSGVVAFVRFIVCGGYANQIRVTKELGLLGGYSEKFTSGTTGSITSGIVGKILLVLVCVEFILLMINYFRFSGKAKRIVMIVDLAILAVQVFLITIVFGIAIGKLTINEEAAYEALKPFDGMTINPKAILIAYAVLL